MAGEMETTINYSDIDANKMLNKAGLLELSGQIKGYIQANMPSSSSTSYTAGDGIDITNDVISSTFDKSYQAPWGVLIDAGLTATFTATTVPANTDKDTVLYYLKCGKTITFPTSGTFGNWWGGLIQEKDLYQIGFVYYYVLNNNNYLSPTRNNFSSSGTTKLNSIAYQNNIMPLGDTLIFGSRNNIAKCLASLIRYDNSTSGLTADRLKAAIDELAARPVVNLPADPSADGTYVLQNTVSSGTATYSWGTPSGGGGGTTYTAGTGISIENGVISINLANAEEEEF